MKTLVLDHHVFFVTCFGDLSLSVISLYKSKAVITVNQNINIISMFLQYVSPIFEYTFNMLKYMLEIYVEIYTFVHMQIKIIRDVLWDTYNMNIKIKYITIYKDI